METTSLKNQSLDQLTELFLDQTVRKLGTNEKVAAAILKEVHDRDEGEGSVNRRFVGQNTTHRDEFNYLLQQKLLATPVSWWERQARSLGDFKTRILGMAEAETGNSEAPKRPQNRLEELRNKVETEMQVTDENGSPFDDKGNDISFEYNRWGALYCVLQDEEFDVLTQSAFENALDQWVYGEEKFRAHKSDYTLEGISNAFDVSEVGEGGSSVKAMNPIVSAGEAALGLGRQVVHLLTGAYGMMAGATEQGRKHASRNAGEGGAVVLSMVLPFKGMKMPGTAALVEGEAVEALAMAGEVELEAVSLPKVAAPNTPPLSLSSEILSQTPKFPTPSGMGSSGNPNFGFGSKFEGLNLFLESDGFKLHSSMEIQAAFSSAPLPLSWGLTLFSAGHSVR